ncbi:hypothetical protein V8G54_024733 [Vigna mungo]|uniref:Hydroxyproline O-arabinosyltransferase-like domain-containing protein n=1 Tax=Vigna mungo TaxID=3915 RepID=A0AAQ3N6T9_VIGMU
MGRASTFLIIFIVLGSSFATYNLVTMLRRYGSSEGVAVSDGGLFFDPIFEMPDHVKNRKTSKAPFHVALTATDAPYNKWQCRVMYYWYKQQKKLPGSEMGGFTRILHSGKSDNLMDEIPTVVVDPLAAGLDRGYIVLNRPWAFVQWLEKAKIEEEYVLMAEPDHIFLRPLPNLAYGGHPAAFPFFYIKPDQNEKIIRKFYPEEYGPVTNVDPIGNSPVIIRKISFSVSEDLNADTFHIDDRPSSESIERMNFCSWILSANDLISKIAPTWMNVSLKMKEDPETDKAFGWVLEMYAYAVASALHGVRHILRKDFMLQPPWDLETRKKYILHYTYGCDYNMKIPFCLTSVFHDAQGELTYGKIGEWRFDKRSHLRGPPPKNLPLPPPGVPESVVTLVKMVNEASANIPNWETT